MFFKMFNDIYLTLKRHLGPLRILFVTWGVYFVFLFSRILEWGPDGIWGGHVNVWSDWACHIGMVNLFATKSPSDWFAYHPFFSAGKFTYPFMTNLISGLLMRAGIPLVAAMEGPSILYCFLLLLGLYLVLFTLFKSKKQALAGIFVFFLSSGPGFLGYLKDLFENFSWSSLIFPAKDYTVLPDYQWYAGNVIEGLIAPQRAFLLGMTLACWAVFGFFRGLELLNQPQAEMGLVKKYWLFSSTLIGILPYTHVHSLIAIVPGLALVVLDQWRRDLDWENLGDHYRVKFSFYKAWLYLILPAATLGLAYYFFILRGGIQNTHFQSWSPGWTSQGGFWGWLVLWTRIWGLALPLAIWGWFKFIKKEGPRPLKIFVSSFFFVFALANLIFFQPVAWDNSKLFFWCYLFFGTLIVQGLSDFFSSPKIWQKCVGVLLLGSLTISGVLEVYRLQWISRNHYQMTNQEDITLGLQLRERTGPRDIFLTQPTHNHFVMMWAARSIVMGFSPWVWNYGFLYEETEKDVKLLYKGGDTTPALLAKHHIRYVVIGPGELQEMGANEKYFADHYRLAFFNRNYRIFDVQDVLPCTPANKFFPIRRG